MPILTVVRIALLALFLGAGAVIAALEFRGPFQFVLPVQSPLNSQSLIGLSFLLILLLHGRTLRNGRS